MATPIRFSILDLPDELIALIIEFVEDHKTLRRLARTCHRIQVAAEYQLYRSILIRSGFKADSIKAAFEKRAERAKSLQVLNIPCDPEQRQSYDSVKWLLRSCKNLRELTFESPECNTNHFEDHDAWSRMSGSLFQPLYEASCSPALGTLTPGSCLHNMQKLTIHLNGERSPYWTLDASSIHLFLHPSLQELRISCVHIRDDAVPSFIRKSFTPLKKLTLEECNITNHGLLGILSIPKALETLYLGENCHNVRHFRGSYIGPGSNFLFKRNASLAISALKQQAHSLRELTYVTMPTDTLAFGSSSTVDCSFADFHALEKITLIGSCLSFERAVLTLRAPPNLKHLVATASRRFLWSPLEKTAELEWEWEKTHIPFFRAPSISLPETLESFDLVFAEQEIFVHWETIAHQQPPSSRLTSVARGFAGNLGVKLRVFVSFNCSEQGKGYYPPYLYGEREPKKYLVLEGSKFVGPVLTDEEKKVYRQSVSSRVHYLADGIM